MADILLYKLEHMKSEDIEEIYRYCNDNNTDIHEFIKDLLFEWLDSMRSCK